ncbi:MAG: hypothetical protein AB8B82_05860 [Roseovarius sp.]
MTSDLSHTRFAVNAFPNKGERPRELTRTMPAHPLSYMQLPYDPEHTLYNSRLTSEKLDTATDDEMYRAVRTNVIFRHTGELPIEISGPDAETMLIKVFTRSVSSVKPGRCSYQFACYHDGGVITDGVLLRLSQDRFWMAGQSAVSVPWAIRPIRAAGSASCAWTIPHAVPACRSMSFALMDPLKAVILPPCSMASPAIHPRA